jgi:hypothetical protein
LSDDEKIHAAGDRIFDFVQGLLMKGDFGTCNDLLSAIDVARLRPPLMIAFLSLTLAAKDKLAVSRDSYYSRVQEAMAIERGEEKTTRLLSKYR